MAHKCDGCRESTSRKEREMSNKIFVPVEQFYLYVTKSTFPKEVLSSAVYNVGNKCNYDKFAKILKRAIKYLPPELEVEIRVRRADK